MNANVVNLENQRLREEQPRPEPDDDEILEHVHALMERYPAYKREMALLVEQLLIDKGETVAINMNLPFPLEG
jgi:hypothetical protein